VTVLAAGWLLLSALSGVGALIVLSKGASGTEQRIFAALSLLLAALATTGAFGLLRRKPWSRALLATTGLVALAVSAFFAYRAVTTAAAPAAEIAATEPDAANALALFRAGSAVAFLLQAVPLILALAFLRHPSVRLWLGIQPGPRRGPDPLVLVAAGAVVVAALSFFLSKNRAVSRAPARPEKAFAPAPPETFVWNGQPITFVPPPAAWTRERHAEGGRKGVSFTRSAAPPSRIVVADAALEPAPLTVEEALSRLRLTPEQFRSADSALVGEPVAAAVSGLPAFQTDYTLRERSMQHRGREFLVVSGRHAFVISFLGRETDLPVLENLVASVHFPDPGARLGGVRTIDDTAPRAETRGDVLKLRVGEQRVTVRVPPGWEHVDYGSRQEFRSAEQAIALVDGGELPAGVTQASVDNDAIIDRALRLFDHDPRRWDVGFKRRVRAGAREALAVDTWDPLTHVVHKRTILIVNERRLLVAGTLRGSFETTGGPLGALVASVKFPD
jgi:hypothetical protein